MGSPLKIALGMLEENLLVTDFQIGSAYLSMAFCMYMFAYYFKLLNWQFDLRYDRH